MNKKHLVIIGVIIGIISIIYFVVAYSSYGAPFEFGNVTTTTCWIGGDYGELNCTGNANFGGNVTTTYFIGDTLQLSNDSTVWNMFVNSNGTLVWEEE